MFVIVYRLCSKKALGANLIMMIVSFKKECLGLFFCPHTEVDYMKQLKTLQRAERSKVMRELDQEKHILRQMQGNV